MDFKVSKTLETDYSDWAALYRLYAEFYKMPMNDEILDKVWSWIQDAGTEFFCLVARDGDGKPIGLTHFRPMFSPLRGTKVGFLDDLYVAEAYRGQGVVEQLFEAMDVEAKRFGWPFVRWLTGDDNHRAQGFYNKVADRTRWVTYQMNIQTGQIKE